MGQVRAFVGHSFSEDDADVVRDFTQLLDRVAKLLPSFSWQHAEPAEPREITDKVLALFQEKELFIAMCTKKETVGIEQNALNLMRGLFSKSNYLVYKTSDWVIQEIGLAIGLGCKLIILLEEGVRSPGGLQGSTEYITFARSSPEKAFIKLLEMITVLTSGAETRLTENQGPKSLVKVEDNRAIQEEATPSPEPQNTWLRTDYEFAYFNALIGKDDSRCRRIDEAYKEHYITNDKDDDKASWPAFTESTRVLFGGGKIENLRTFSSEHPENPSILHYLALSFDAKGEAKSAAEAYENAALKSKDESDICFYRGRAAEKYHDAGLVSDADRIIRSLLAMRLGDKKNEIRVLRALDVYSNNLKRSVINKAVLERLIELSPDDDERRFTLAYRYSEDAEDDLSLFHYSKTALQTRSLITWNNMGVAFARLGMPGKSINAYRKAEEEGETLAMANIAEEFRVRGFFEEANVVCAKALSIEGYHKNVLGTLSSVQSDIDAEDKKAILIEERASKRSRLLRKAGQFLVAPFPEKFPMTWKGLDCTLDVVTIYPAFQAKGRFQRSRNGLMHGLGLGLGMLAPEEWINVEVKGLWIGCMLEGSILRRNELASDSSLWSADVEQRCILLLSENNFSIEFIEGKDYTSYTIEPA